MAQTNKVALVTGGSRGIGAAIVRRLAKDGATVIFTFKSSEAKAHALVAAIREEGGMAVAMQADSADVHNAKAVVERIVEQFGRLDILVNSAGMLALAPFDAFSLDTFEQMVAVNIRAVFAFSQAALAHMGPGGRIVTIGSVSGVQSGFPTSSLYSMTKAAVAGMVRGMAIDLAPRQITVNNIQPGPIETDMNPSDGPHAEALRTMIPLGRVGRPEEVAAMVAYLVSPDAAYVTGSSLTIDGGYSA